MVKRLPESTKEPRGKIPPSNCVLLASSTDKTLCLLAVEKCLKGSSSLLKKKEKTKFPSLNVKLAGQPESSGSACLCPPQC